MYCRHILYLHFNLWCRYFPKIFGPNEDQPLDKESTVKEFDKLTAEVYTYLMLFIFSSSSLLESFEYKMFCINYIKR